MSNHQLPVIAAVEHKLNTLKKENRLYWTTKTNCGGKESLSLFFPDVFVPELQIKHTQADYSVCLGLNERLHGREVASNGTGRHFILPIIDTRLYFN